MMATAFFFKLVIQPETSFPVDPSPNCDEGYFANLFPGFESPAKFNRDATRRGAFYGLMSFDTDSNSLGYFQIVRQTRTQTT